MRAVSGDQGRDLIPEQLVLPAEDTCAVIVLTIVVEADPVRVVAPGLEQARAVLSSDSVELVKRYCLVWTRWLYRAGLAVIS